MQEGMPTAEASTLAFRSPRTHDAVAPAIGLGDVLGRAPSRDVRPDVDLPGGRVLGPQAGQQLVSDREGVSPWRDQRVRLRTSEAATSLDAPGDVNVLSEVLRDSLCPDSEYGCGLVKAYSCSVRGGSRSASSVRESPERN